MWCGFEQALITVYKIKELFIQLKYKEKIDGTTLE